MPQFTHLTPPVDGTPLTRKQGQLVVPDDPIHSVHRRRRHRARHLACQRARLRRGGEESVWRRTPPRLVRDSGGRESEEPDRRVAAQRHAGGRQDVQDRDQGPADHAGRRRLPQHQRHPSPSARPVCVRPAGALLHGHAGAGQAPGQDGHRHLPREHRGRVRRHRVSRARRRPRSSSRSCRARWASACRRTPASASSRCPRRPASG